MSGRVYDRKFDWDEARRLRDAGLSYANIAQQVGVTANAVYRVLKPGEAERQAAVHKLWQQSGRCDECGGPMNRLSRSHGHTRCHSCASKAQVKADPDGNLYCPTCDTWKPPEAFYPDAGAGARGRSSECRVCSNARRRANRNANRERERAYWRDYKRRGKTRPAPAEDGESHRKETEQSALSS